MEIFHKGSDPPPLFFGSYGTGATACDGVSTKCVAKLWIGSDPHPPLRKISITKPPFFLMASLSPMELQLDALHLTVLISSGKINVISIQLCSPGK